MTAELITVFIDGIDYSGWMTCDITRSMETLSGTFSISLTERWPGMSTGRPVICGSRCTVKVGNTPLIDGYVDDVHISYGSLNHDVVISGRDVAGDLVDCGAESQEWHGQKLEQIVSAIASVYSIRVGVQTNTGEPFDKFRIQEGETAWSAIDRACRMRGVLCMSDGLGNIILCRTAVGAAVNIIRGGPNGVVLDATGTFTNKDRFSVYRVKGQRSGSDESEPEVASHGLAEVHDKAVTRFRLRVIIGEDQGDSGSLLARANWECTVARGRSQAASITVQGWRDADGAIWAPNRRVRVQCDWLRLDDEMLISTVRLRQSQDGTIADLNIVHPDTFAAEPPAIEQQPGTKAGQKPGTKAGQKRSASPRDDIGWSGGKIWVEGYTKKNGTQVEGYWRKSRPSEEKTTRVSGKISLPPPFSDRT